MQRREDWQERLLAALSAHERQPFAWDESDCFRLCMDAAEALIGHDPWHEVRGRYRTARGAARVLRGHGCTDVAGMFALRFAPVAGALARRGDIGTIEQDGEIIGCVVLGTHLVAKQPMGIVRAPREQLAQAFKIGW